MPGVLLSLLLCALSDLHKLRSPRVLKLFEVKRRSPKVLKRFGVRRRSPKVLKLRGVSKRSPKVLELFGAIPLCALGPTQNKKPESAEAD